MNGSAIGIPRYGKIVRIPPMLSDHKRESIENMRVKAPIADAVCNVNSILFL